MTRNRCGTLVLILAALAPNAQAQAPRMSDGVVRIGILNDRSGPYADLSGEGSAIAARLAVEEFGAKVNGVPVEIVTGDHQNKTDVGVGIARKWFDADGVDVVADVSHSAISLALAGLVKERRKLVFHNSGTTELTGKSCTPRSAQWLYNVYATSANVATREDVQQGLDSFFILSVDYALGQSISKVFRAGVAAKGGKVVGEVSHPLNTTDFSSYLLQAQASGAKGVLLANGGADLGNAAKQATEFGLPARQVLMAGAMTTAEIESSGLAAMQGLRAVSFYEWDLNDRTRAFAKAFAARNGGRLPSGPQASTYSQVRHYLRAVQAAGTDDADAVLAKMRELAVDDGFAVNGRLREDGQLIHDMFLVRVKKPSESKGKGDYTQVLRTIPGEQAFQTPAQSECPLLRK